MARLFVGSFLAEAEGTRIEQSGLANRTHFATLTRSAIKMVTAANLHITWVFLGEVAESDVQAVQESFRRQVAFLKLGTSVEESALSLDRPRRKYTPDGLGEKLAIDVEYDYLEAWPKVGSARVLVATPTVVPDEVIKIGLSLRQAFAGAGKVDENEPRNLLFRPHLTIARLKPEANLGDGQLIEALSKMLPIKQHIDSLHLIKSDLSQGSSKYEIIDSAW